jgi:hypothetical protein
MPLIPALWRLRQNLEFYGNLSYTVRHVLKTKHRGRRGEREWFGESINLQLYIQYPFKRSLL